MENKRVKSKFLNSLHELKLTGEWLVPKDDVLITRKIGDSEIGDVRYEKSLRDSILKHLKKRRVFLDVGANVGIWSVPMAPLFKKVFAFEPDNMNMHCLRENTKGIENITYKNVGLGEKDGLTIIQQCPKNCGNSSVVSPSNVLLPDEVSAGDKASVGLKKHDEIKNTWKYK